MTTRRGLWAAAAAALAGCRSGRRGSALPETAGAWKRVSVEEQPASAAEAPVTASVVRRIERGRYEGPGKVEVTAYELSSSAAALDAVQRWRASADAVIFYRDEYFVVVRHAGADRAALNAFVRDLGKALAK